MIYAGQAGGYAIITIPIVSRMPPIITMQQIIEQGVPSWQIQNCIDYHLDAADRVSDEIQCRRHNYIADALADVYDKVWVLE